MKIYNELTILFSRSMTGGLADILAMHPWSSIKSLAPMLKGEYPGHSVVLTKDYSRQVVVGMVFKDLSGNPHRKNWWLMTAEQLRNLGFLALFQITGEPYKVHNAVERAFPTARFGPRQYDIFSADESEFDSCPEYPEVAVVTLESGSRKICDLSLRW